MIFMDLTGQIQAVAFGDEAEIVAKLLHLNSICEVEHAVVRNHIKGPNETYPLPFELHFNYKMKVNFVPNWNFTSAEKHILFLTDPRSSWRSCVSLSTISTHQTQRFTDHQKQHPHK